MVDMGRLALLPYVVQGFLFVFIKTFWTDVNFFKH